MGARTSQAVDRPARLRVLSYNIHHGEGVDGKLDLERIAEVVRSSQADLAALQEVDQGVDRTRRVDQPAALAKLTGMHAVFEKNIDHQGGAYGNAVLSKWPVKSHRNIVLPCLLRPGQRDDREQRGALAVEVETPSGDEITFVSTHLDSRPWEDERLKSAVLLNQELAGDGQRSESSAGAAERRPTLLVGDLNAVRSSGVMDEFAKCWTIAGDRELPTVPAGSPRRQIDFVLLHPASRWRVVEVQVVDEPVASDHRPLVAVLELQPAPR